MNLSDNPIKNLKEDRIDRAGLADKFAQQVLKLDASEGIVVGVLGPWGCGKTSFVNLARRKFEDRAHKVLEFNPWMFSSTGHLINSFFRELISELNSQRLALAGLADMLLPYGVAVSSSFLPGGTEVARQIRAWFTDQNEGAVALKPRIEAELGRLNKPIIVLLDDIDRLSTSEIREVFKLVRLIANFPNVIYIVAFDRDRVERALGDQGVEGRDYLEKILQFHVDLPILPDRLLRREINSGIRRGLDRLRCSHLMDWQRWEGILVEIVSPLMANMRDVKRYSVAIYTAMSTNEGRIQLTDLFALQAIRLFLPDVHKGFANAVEPLTGSKLPKGDVGSSAPVTQFEKRIEDLISAAGKHDNVVRKLISLLFPSAKHFVDPQSPVVEADRSWITRRLIANKDIFRLYLENYETEHMKAFVKAEKAWEHMDDEHEFESKLINGDPSELHEVIALLELYRGEFSARKVVIPGTTVLVNLFSLEEEITRQFHPSLKGIVNGISIRLIESQKDQSERENCLREILGNLKSCYCKWQLISVVRNRVQEAASGQAFVTKKTVLSCEAKWREEVRTLAENGTIDDLNRERDLLGTLVRG